jgi:hypothetical protein
LKVPFYLEVLNGGSLEICNHLCISSQGRLLNFKWTLYLNARVIES